VWVFNNFTKYKLFFIVLINFFFLLKFID
jgi:hypothetical protein